MDKVILLVVMVGIVAVVAKVRADAARARKDTMRRITADHQARPTLSPTADLFREAGIPVPEELAVPAPAAPDQPGAEPPTDLATIFAGIELPAGLVAVDGTDPHHMTLATDADPARVTADLEAEMARLGCSLEWVSDRLGEVSHPDGRASIRIDADESGSGTTVQLASL